MCETALYSRLTGHAGLTALIAGRVYIDQITQDVTDSAVIFQRISTVRHPAMGADLALVEARMQVRCIATKALDSIAVATQVRAALQRWGGTAAGIVVQQIFIENEAGRYDPDIKKHEQLLDFIVWYEE